MTLRLGRPDLTLLAFGFSLVAGALLFPPWRALGVSTTMHRPRLSERDFALMRRGISPDTGWVTTDTTYWTIPFASIFDAPTKENPLVEDAFSRRLEAETSDSNLTEDVREARFLELAEEYGKAQEARLRRARIPDRFRKQALGTDTVGGQIYTVSRTDHFEFNVDWRRLTMTMASLIVATVALLFGARAWRARPNS